MTSVILTRTEEENSRVAPLFEEHGFVVYSVPAIDLVPLGGDSMVLPEKVGGDDPVLLTSMFATRLWLDVLRSASSIYRPSGYYIVGRGSARLLKEDSGDVQIHAVADSAEELLLHDFPGVARILYPCSTRRRDGLPEGLLQRGIELVEMPLYSPHPPEDIRERLQSVLAIASPPVIFTFFSPSAVNNLFDHAGDRPGSAIFAAIGQTTADALRQRGIASIIIPEHPGIEHLLNAIEERMKDEGAASGEVAGMLE